MLQQSRLAIRLDKMERYVFKARGSALLSAALAALVCLLAPVSFGEDMIVLRQFDEVYFKDGKVSRGTLFETDRADEFKIKDNRTNTSLPFNMSEVKEIRRKATAEGEMERIAKENASRADVIVKLANEVIRRFDIPRPKIIAMLEKTGSNSPEVLALLTEQYLYTNQNAMAMRTSESLVRSAPNQGRHFMLRGLAYRANDNIEAAGKDFEKAFQLAPESQEVSVARAEYLLASGRPDEAKSVFTSALAKNPRNIAALIGQGTVHLKQGEFIEAEKSFLDALGVDYRQKDAHIGLAAVKLMTRRYEDAYQEARSVLNIDNKSADAYALQAFAKLLAGDRESLAAFSSELKNALAERPNQPRLLLASAVALEREAKYADADNTAESGVIAKQKREDAANKYNELIVADPPDAYLQYFIGERRFKQGDYAGAEPHFQKAIKSAPNYAPLRGAAGAVALRLGKWEAAKEAYTSAIRLAPAQDAALADYHAGKGLALLKVKLFEDAANCFKQAREIDRRNVAALCGLGYLANGAANKQSAIEFFQQALAADGACNYAADALTKIFAQEHMALEYLTFTDGTLPPTWKLRPGGTVRPTIVNGEVLFAGTQTGSAGGKVEIYRDVKAEEFVRLEADLEMSPTSPVTFGLRIGAATNSVTSFEMEFAKDETRELKVRYRDYGGQQQNWQSLTTEWPADGRVRLGIDTDDFTTGKVRLWINGSKKAELKMLLQKPGRMYCGVYVQAPPKEIVHAIVDNIVVVVRGTGQPLEANDALLITKDEEKKPAPLPSPEK